MATRRVFNVLVDEAGRPLANVVVSIQLSSPRWLSSETKRLGGWGIRVQTDANGRWEAELMPNDSLDDPNSYYIVREGVETSAPVGGSRRPIEYLIRVPSTGFTEPIWVANLLITPPRVTPPPNAVMSIAAENNPPLQGDIRLLAGSGIRLQQDNNAKTIKIINTGGGSGGGADEKVVVFKDGTQIGTEARRLDFRGDGTVDFVVTEDEVNDQFDIVANVKSGVITDAHIAANANIAKSKISPTGQWAKAELPSDTVYTTDNQELSNKTLVNPTIKDVDTTPVANRQLRVIDGEIVATDTTGAEGRHIRDTSIKGTGTLVPSLNADKIDGLEGADLEKVINKGVANGYAPLDANAKLPLAHLPSHTHDASEIASGRLSASRLPTSSNANRFLVVRAANADPTYDTIQASDLPSHTHSPSQITPQGSGSGLDADTLDGQHASAFASATHTHTKSQITDLETITTTPTPNAVPKADTSGKIALGWIPQGSGSNLNADKLDGLDSADFEKVVNKGAANGYAPLDADAKLPLTHLPGHTHSPSQITPQGSGSGLDADTVDGQHASDFAPVSHTHTKSQITDLEQITTIPTANAVPKAGADGKIAVGWIPQGSGSGLDADRLDGLDSTSFERVANKGVAGGYAPLDTNAKLPLTHLPSHTHDASEITSGRLSASRLPTSSAANRFLVVRTADSDPTYDTIQASDLPSHTHTPSQISPQGSGSGLDADTVDGQHASAFAPASHTHTRSQITDFAHASTHEAGGSDPITGNLDANARVAVKQGGTVVGVRRAINFIAGSNVSLNITDDATNEEVDITISATGGGSSSHNLLDGVVHPDTEATTVQRGMLIVGKLVGAVIKWAGLALGMAGKFLKSTGTDVVWGDVEWEEVQNKPSTFPPSAHTHSPSDISPQGSDSGLDADTVDGYHASAFASATHTHDAAHITSGRLNISRLPTSPNANRFLVVRTANSDPTYDTIQASDLPTHTHSPDQISPQGSGSGLDADTVDGQHASDFAPADHTHTKSQITDLETITTTPTPNAVPKADDTGKIDLGWIPQGSGSNLNADKLDGLDSTDFEKVINKGIANGYAPLDANAKLPLTHLPSHTHDASDISSGRLSASRLPTSSIANRFLVIRTANSDPTYDTIQASDLPAHTHSSDQITPQGSGSGLDADTVDGLHANAFALADHTHTRSQITDFAHANTHVSGGSDPIIGDLDANARVTVKQDGTVVGTRRAINFIAGTNVSLSISDDPTNEEVDITISAVGGGGGGSSPHNLLDGVVHLDTEATTVQRGMLVVGKLSGAVVKWGGLPLGAAGRFLRSNGTDAVWDTIQASDLPAHTHSPDQITPQGSGSGLDADTVDGYHANAFAPASHTHDAADITSGRLSVSRLPTSPNANRFLVVRTANSDPVYDTIQASDLPSHTHSPDQITPQGAGSGLDADTVDGYHASDFALADHTHTKSQITDLETITTTPTPYAVPKADSSGKIDLGWIPQGPGSGLNADKLDGLESTDFERIVNKGVANGYAPLDANAKLPTTHLPSHTHQSSEVDMPVTERTSSYTLQLSDKNSFIKMTSSSAVTVTIPTNSSVPLPVGTKVAIMKYGTGDVTIQGAAGVTVRDPNNQATITTQYDVRVIVKIGTDEWVIV